MFPLFADVSVSWALRNMKNRKAPGIDNISAELLKADLETSTDQISKILDLVWIRENVPSDWRKGLIIKLAKKGDLTWLSISAGSDGSGLFSTSQKCSFHLFLTSFSFVSTFPFLSFTLSICLGLSLLRSFDFVMS
jgi:hypothetical protein